MRRREESEEEGGGWSGMGRVVQLDKTCWLLGILTLKPDN